MGWGVKDAKREKNNIKEHTHTHPYIIWSQINAFLLESNEVILDFEQQNKM